MNFVVQFVYDIKDLQGQVEDELRGTRSQTAEIKKKLDAHADTIVDSSQKIPESYYEDIYKQFLLV